MLLMSWGRGDGGGRADLFKSTASFAGPAWRIGRRAGRRHAFGPALTLNGTTGGDAALSGNLSFSSAVPEPATWAFMLVGFGAVGYSMRKRPTYKLAQAV